MERLQPDRLFEFEPGRQGCGRGPDRALVRVRREGGPQGLVPARSTAIRAPGSTPSTRTYTAAVTRLWASASSPRPPRNRAGKICGIAGALYNRSPQTGANNDRNDLAAEYYASNRDVYDAAIKSGQDPTTFAMNHIMAYGATRVGTSSTPSSTANRTPTSPPRGWTRPRTGSSSARKRACRADQHIQQGDLQPAQPGCRCRRRGPATALADVRVCRTGWAGPSRAV